MLQIITELKGALKVLKLTRDKIIEKQISISSFVLLDILGVILCSKLKYWMQKRILLIWSEELKHCVWLYQNYQIDGCNHSFTCVYLISNLQWISWVRNTFYWCFNRVCNSIILSFSWLNCWFPCQDDQSLKDSNNWTFLRGRTSGHIQQEEKKRERLLSIFGSFLKKKYYLLLGSIF